jgi:hypothetical protein
MAAADLRIRASVEDGAKARADLEALGTAGTRSLTQIQQASSAAAQQLQGLQTATTRVAQAGAGLELARAGLASTADAAGDATAAMRTLGGQVLASGGNLQSLAQAASGFLTTFGGPLGAAAGAAIGVLSSQFLTAGESAAEAQRRTEIAMRGIKAESEGVRDVIRQIGDLFLTASERAANLANQQRALLVQSADLRLSNQIQLQDDAASRIPAAERRLRELEEQRRVIEANEQRNRRTGGAQPVENSALTENLGRSFSARTELQGLRAQLEEAQRNVAQLNEFRARAQNAGVVGTDQFGPNLPEVERRAAATERLSEGEREYQRILRESETAIDRTRTEEERRTNTMGELFGLLRDGTLTQERYEAGVLAVNRAYEARQAIEQQRATERAAQDEVRAVERAQREADQFAGRWGDRLADATTQGLYDGFTKGGDIFTTLTRTFGNLLRQAVSAALSQQVFAPLVSNLVGGSGAAGASGGGLAGSLSGLRGLGSLESLGGYANSASSYLGLGNLFGSGLSPIVTQGVTPLTSPMVPGLSAAEIAAANGTGAFTSGGVGASLGGFLGGAGAGFGAGMLVNRLAGGNQTGGTVGSGVGALAGAAIGSIVPGIGTLIGGLLGGAAGGGLGGLFGPKKSFSGGEVIYGVNASGQFDVLGSPSKNFDMTASIAAVREQTDAVNKALADAGIRLSTSEVIGGNRFRGEGAQYGTVAAGKGSATPDITGTLAQQVQRLGFSDSDNVNSVIRRDRGANPSLQGILEDAKFVRDVYEKALEAIRNPTSQFSEAVQAVVGPFDQAIQKARELGLATEELAAAREVEFGRLVEQRNATLNGFWTSFDVRTRRATGADAQTTDLIQFDAASTEEVRNLREQLRQLGTTAGEAAEFITALESTQTAERLAIQRTYNEQAIGLERQRVAALLQQGQGIRDFIDAQNATGASGATAVDQLSAAQSVYARDLQLARGNDSAALGRITGQAQTLLGAAGSVYASSGEFQGIRSGVLADLANLPATLGQDATTAAALGRPNDALTATLASLIPGQQSVASAFGGITDMVGRQDALLASSGRLEALGGRMIERLGSGFDGMISRAETLIARMETLIEETRGARTDNRLAALERRVASAIPDYQYQANTA